MEARPRQLFAYRLPNGHVPFAEWLDSLKDPRGYRAVETRLIRLKQGNLGDHKKIGAIQELRLDVGPGYRIYVGEDGPTLVVLLVGGDKSNQSKDIAKAQTYWADHWSKR